MNHEAVTSDGETPLALACAGGDEQCIQMLIAKGANINKGCLHAAARWYVVSLLLFSDCLILGKKKKVS